MFAMRGCNFWLVGFLDIWLVLLLMPVSVALTVTMFLNADSISNNLVLMLPNFEIVWFVLPVLVLFATGIISFRIGVASISNR